MRFKKGGMLDDDEWAEHVVDGLRRIYERMDDRDSDLNDIRDGVKDFLNDYDTTQGIKYGKLLDVISGFHHAINEPQWMLIDMVVYKCIPIIGIMNRSSWNTFNPGRQERIRSKLHEWILYAIYEVEKVHVFKREKREQQIADSAIGVISRDVAPAYDRGPGRGVRRKIAEDRAMGNDDDDDEDDGDDGEEEKLDFI